MNKIDEIALRIGSKLSAQGLVATSAAYDIAFAHALLAELSKDAEPAVWTTRSMIGTSTMQDENYPTPLFTHPAPVIASEQKPVARVDANDDCCWADILPDNDVIIGQLLYASPPNTADIEQRVAEADSEYTSQHRKADEKPGGAAVGLSGLTVREHLEITMNACAKCGENIDGMFVCTIGGGVMHRHCYEQENPPMVAQTIYQMARGRGDPVLTAEVITAMVPVELADQKGQKQYVTCGQFGGAILAGYLADETPSNAKG